MYSLHKSSSLEIVKLLIDSGANLDLQTQLGTTALMLSVSVFNSDRGGNLETVKLLIDSGANLDLQDEIRWTAMRVAKTIRDKNISNEVQNLFVRKTPPISEKTEPKSVMSIINWKYIAARTTSVEHFKASIPEAFRTLDVYLAAAVAGNFKFELSDIPEAALW